MEREKNNSSFSSLKKPEKCHLWRKGNLTNTDLKFEQVESYQESSHFDRSLLKCSQCGQLYFYEFYEEVDWEEGNNRIYTTFIPVDNDRNQIESLKQKSPFELLGVSPRLQWDNNKPIKWIR